jgi:hypothetical protein
LDEYENYRNTPSALAALEALPEVVESNSDSSWRMFLALQASNGDDFSPTQPFGPSSLRAQSQAGRVTVQEVMVEARRHNRVAPLAQHWQRLYEMLKSATGGEPPEPMSGEELATSPPLVRRIRIRDQVEWAAEHAQLQLVLSFFQSLPEEHWVHIGR